MNRLKQLRNEQGFTIIEVMIVLAIAGVIMLIVFLAIPALQRNTRNQQRNDDAAKISAAVTQCLANKNGVLASCSTPGALNPAFINPANNAQLTSITVPGGAASLTNAAITFGTAAGGCSPDGSATAAGAGARSFSVLYQLEGTTGTITKCIAS